MGMTCTLHRATENEIDRLIKEPAAVDSFLDPDDGSAPRVRTVRPKGLFGLILRLFPITITEVTSEPVQGAPILAEDPDRSIDIEKAWHGLHFLFTGTADEGEEPACYLVRGGEDLDDEGQTRALRPDQVRRFADYLSALTPAELKRRYDPERMSKLAIYPDRIWMRPASAGESPLEWLFDCFSTLREFMSRAAASGQGVIIDVG
jgi:Domain of unknown function (DUF1877)